MDFDEASKEWRKNKLYQGKGYFQYKCSVVECKKPIYLHTTEHRLFSRRFFEMFFGF